MTKKALIKKIEKLGMGKLIIENADTAPNAIRLSCEDIVELPNGDYISAGDYWGEFRGNYPWIHPALEKLAKDAGSYWEWENAAVISLYL